MTIFCDCIKLPTIIGYQVILMKDSDQTGKIYTNISNCSASASVKITSNGTYHLTVFSIEENKGITKSIILYEGNITAGNNDIFKISNGELPKLL